MLSDAGYGLSKFLFVVSALFLSPMSPFKNKMLIYQQFQKIRMVGASIINRVKSSISLVRVEFTRFFYLFTQNH